MIELVRIAVGRLVEDARSLCDDLGDQRLPHNIRRGHRKSLLNTTPIQRGR
jgi:hypothetical protein